MAGRTVTDADGSSVREQWFGWCDGSMFTPVIGSLAVIIGGGLVRVI